MQPKPLRGVGAGAGVVVAGAGFVGTLVMVATVGVVTVGSGTVVTGVVSGGSGVVVGTVVGVVAGGAGTPQPAWKASTGCSSIPFGATPRWWWRRSKKARPVTVTQGAGLRLV